jgi:hypothetical protein
MNSNENKNDDKKNQIKLLPGKKDAVGNKMKEKTILLKFRKKIIQLRGIIIGIINDFFLLPKLLVIEN